MWWQLGTYEANVVVVDGVVVTWYHHRSWRRLTRDAWILTHVTVVPCFLYISRPSDTKGNILNDQCYCERVHTEDLRRMFLSKIMVYSLDVEKDISLLAENRPDVTDSHRGVIHLIPLTIACLRNTTEEMAALNIFAKNNHRFYTSYISNVYFSQLLN